MMESNQNGQELQGSLQQALLHLPRYCLFMQYGAEGKLALSKNITLDKLSSWPIFYLLSLSRVSSVLSIQQDLEFLIQ